jgi:hypothetical protein
METIMRRIVLALAFCFAISPLAVSAQTTPPATKHKAKKVKAHKAPKVKKAKKAVKHTAA